MTWSLKRKVAAACDGSELPKDAVSPVKVASTRRTILSISAALGLMMRTFRGVEISVLRFQISNLRF